MKDLAPVCYLNSNDGTALLGFGSGPSFSLWHVDDLPQLDAFIEQHRGSHLFGYLSYALKSHVDQLPSPPNLRIPLAYFWVPETTLSIDGDNITFFNGGPSEALENFLKEIQNPQPIAFPKLGARTSKTRYIQQVESIKENIQLGNLYETNYCQEFYATNLSLSNPESLYAMVNERTQAPFSALLVTKDVWLACGSPERFLKKTGLRLSSHPIKGTTARSRDPVLDLKQLERLRSSQKECAENVMIVDLVRNDLSKIATPGSVHVDELLGLYRFETVHHMISTISCSILPSTTFTDIIKATFPMGSMTGAPKRNALRLMSEYEDFNREIYSGSVGYIGPEGDFDFNVVIRSLAYFPNEKYVQCGVGSAITIAADPQQEFEECLLKINRLVKTVYDD